MAQYKFQYRYGKQTKFVVVSAPDRTEAAIAAQRYVLEHRGNSGVFFVEEVIPSALDNEYANDNHDLDYDLYGTN